MWLINVKTRKLELFFDENQVSYAILSHTWDVDEVTFQDMLDGKAKDKKGYQKIDYACRQALKDGLPYAWVDTCSIDKSSSAELSESINAMYSYYRTAKICYAFLADAKVSSSRTEAEDSSEDSGEDCSSHVDDIKDCK